MARHLRLLRRLSGAASNRSHSSLTPVLSADPSRFVAGVTRERLASDPVLAAYFRANFPKWESEPDIADVRAESTDRAARGSETSRLEKSEGKTKVSRDTRLSSVSKEWADLNVRPLYTYLRDVERESGTRRCEDMREVHRLIPGVIYGWPGRSRCEKTAVKTPWNVLHGELDRYHHHFESRVYELSVYDGPDSDEPRERHIVLPRDMQRHPYLNKLWCVNYLEYHPGRTIKVPIRFINEEESPVMKRGGFIASVSRYVPCVVEEGVPIPDAIDLECTGLKLKQVVRMDRLIFPDGVTVAKEVNKEKFLVGTVFGRRAIVADDPEDSG